MTYLFKYTEIQRKNKLVHGEKAVMSHRGNDNKRHKADLDKVCMVLQDMRAPHMN